MEGDSQLSRPISTETKENRKLDKKFEQRFEKFLDGIAEQEEIEKKEFEEAEKAAIMQKIANATFTALTKHLAEKQAK